MVKHRMSDSNWSQKNSSPFLLFLVCNGIPSAVVIVIVMMGSYNDLDWFLNSRQTHV